MERRGENCLMSHISGGEGVYKGHVDQISREDKPVLGG